VYKITQQFLPDKANEQDTLWQLTTQYTLTLVMSLKKYHKISRTANHF